MNYSYLKKALADQDPVSFVNKYIILGELIKHH
jgi:hypothetical protein